MSWLQHKKVLVTGACGGLGVALCRAFKDRGAIVYGGDMPAVIKEYGAVDWSLFPLDVTSRSDWQNLYNQTEGVDVLVHNAGITALDCFRDGGSAMVEKVMAVNFSGTVTGTEIYLDELRQRSGRIVLLSSVAGFAPLYGRTAYAASKHALHGFYGSLQSEERSTGVRALLVSPSFVATGIRDHAAPALSDDGARLTQSQEMTPEYVAVKIVKGVENGRRRLRLGRTSHLAWWMHFFFPAFYEKMMVRTTAGN